jgi:hypothetical protein
MNMPFTRSWPWFFFAAAFESLVAALALVSVPSEGGLSLARVALLGMLAFFFAGGVILGFRARHDAARFDRFAHTSFILSSALLALTCGLSLFLLRYLDPHTLQPYYERLSPLLWYLLVLGIQAVVFLLLLRNGFHLDELSKRKPVYRSAIVAGGFLLAIFIFVALTRIGITPDTGYWGEPGVAILGWQVGLCLLAGLFVLVVGSNVSNSNPRFVNIFLPAGIYLLACTLWLSVPLSILENSFYAPITPPAHVPFPYSDAGFYDYLSHSLLIGTDYLGGIPPRPLYVTFLAILHFFFGQNYAAIIAAQTLLLALFPVALYFLGKKLHSPAAGTIVALLAVFRELVGLWISSNTRVSNSKILTTDFPTALGIAILCLVVIWWLERRDLKSTLVAGGAFGLLLLFRTQSLFTLPFIFILAWMVYQRKTREWVMAGLGFAFATAITVLPWLTHNYTISGKFSFDDPRQVAIIYSQYSFSGNLDLSQFDPEKESVGNRLVSFTLENPGYVSRFIATHFLNTEIGGLLALPLIESFDSLFAPVNLYWVGWDGSLEWYNLVLILFYLAMIAVGFGAAWYRAGWIGLVPLAFNLGYALANGVSRFSSWRYNLPVDWVIYFYFAIGVAEILYGISLLLGAKTRMESGSHVPRSGMLPISSSRLSFGDFRPQYIFILLAFAFVGSLPWLAKGLAQPRYTATRDELVTALTSSGYPAGEINTFLEQPAAVLVEGRLLYPRLYRRDGGMASANPWPAYAVREYARIGFVLLDNRQYNAIFITRDSLDFPHGADAVVLGCRQNGYIEVRVIDFGGKSFQSAPLTQPCE